MTKLTDLKGAENLLQKVDIVNTIEEHVHNTIVKEYNSLSIDGDVEALAKVITLKYEVDGIRIAKFIIANLDKFVVIRKG